MPRKMSPPNAAPLRASSRHVGMSAQTSDSIAYVVSAAPFLSVPLVVHGRRSAGTQFLAQCRPRPYRRASSFADPATLVADAALKKDDKVQVYNALTRVQSVLCLVPQVKAPRFTLKVIAEGGEIEAQAESLVREGCEEAQGFLYSRPIAETD
jgi:hypothetical protein